jgi:hypothetical protein
MVNDSILIIIMFFILIISLGIIAIFTCMSKGRGSELRLSVGFLELLMIDVSIKLQ